MPDNQDLLNQEGRILNQNKTQQDASSENEVNVIPHSEINAEDNQSLAQRITLTEGAPKIKDGPDKQPSIVEKNLQVDQEGNVISAEPETKAEKQEPKKEPSPGEKNIFGFTVANATEMNEFAKQLGPEDFAPETLLSQLIDKARKVTGHGEPETQHTIFENTVLGISDAAIKTVTGGYSIAKDINELKKDGIFIDPKKTAEFEKWMSENLLGKVGTQIEEESKKSALAQFISIFGQFYGVGKILKVEELATKGFQAFNKARATEQELAAYEKGKQVIDKYVQAAKDNNVIVPNKFLADAYEKVAQLNNLSKAQKFGVVMIGGGIAGALISDYADVSFGLDQDVKNDTQDDAWRRIYNRMTSGIQNAFFSGAFHFGVSEVGKKIAEQGKYLAFSNSQLDRLIDYVSSGFRSRGIQSPELKELTDRAIGQQDVSKNTAKYLTDSIDITLAKIADKSEIREGNPAYQTIMQKLNTLLDPAGNKIVNGKVVFNGFTDKELKDFRNFSNEVGISKQNTEELIGHMNDARNIYKDYVNTLLSNGNIQINALQFNKIISDRINNMIKYDFQIHADKNTSIPMLNYKPIASQLEVAGKILQDYAKKSGVTLTDDELKIQLQDILKNVRLDPITKIPKFKITGFDAMDVDAISVINIADNFKGGSFKPTKFFKTEKDLNSFLKFFGQADPNVKNTIINSMMDLGTLSARDNFYTQLIKKSEELIQNGERSVLYPTRRAAMDPKTGLTIASESATLNPKLPWNKIFPKGNIIDNPNGLNVKSSLDPSVYANPINGMFTSELYKDAIEFNQKLATDFLTKNVIYRNLFLIPKAITQMNKTIFDPFTHTKIFTVNATFALGNGNLFIDPKEMYNMFIQSWDALQPQLVSKFTTPWGSTLAKVGTLGLSYRNDILAQRLYNFLLEKRTVYSSSTAQDLKQLLTDIQNGGGKVLDKIYDRFGSSMKKLVNVGHDSYMAGDDIWKIYNFMAEVYKRENAYTKAIANGIIKATEKPSTLDIWNKSAQIVGDIFPNYNQVGTNIKNLRRLPFGNFPSFHAEVVRAGGNTIWEGLQEMKDPALRELGLNRLFSFGLTTAAVIPIIQGIVHGLYGITNRMVAAANSFLPDWSKNSQIVMWKDKNDQFVYIDAQGNFVYDAFSGPAASAIAGADNAKSLDPKTPLIKGMIQGLGSHMYKLMGPYFSEALYVETLQDLFSRNGVDKDGHRIWNPSSPLGDKITKGAMYIANKIGPLGVNRLERIYDSITNTPGPRGQKYELPYELGSFVGNRAIPLNIEEQFPYKITDFKNKIRQSNSLFAGESLKGGQIDPDEIVQNFIKANAARHEALKEMSQTVEDAKVLNFPIAKIAQIMQERGETNAFKYMLANRFIPMDITVAQQKKFVKQYQKLQSEFDDQNYQMPFNYDAIMMINQAKAKMYTVPLNGNFYDYIKPEDYRINKTVGNNVENNKQSFNIPPVNTPNVSPQIVTPNPQQTVATQNEFQRAFPQG